MKEHIIILIVAVSTLMSCNQNSFDSDTELISFLKDPESGFLQTKVHNGTRLSVMYRPIDLLVNQDLESVYTSETIDSLRDNYSNYLYFGINLSKNGNELLHTLPKNTDEFGALANQLSFGMDRKIHLYTSKKDTIEMTDYVYPRMYGLSKTTTLLLVYPRDEKIMKSDKITIAIEDIGMETGELKFKFDTDIIKQEPQLVFE